MKRILAPIVLLTFLLPSFAQGQSLNDWVGKGKGLLCETTGMGCPESVDSNDLVKRDGLYFKKRTDVPFTGKSTGDEQGSIQNGKRVGTWVTYFDNGQLRSKGTFKNGKQDGPWVNYHSNGQLWEKGTYKNNKKEGSWVNYHNNGQVSVKGTYKNGKRDGPHVWYMPDGNVNEQYTGTFKNGVKVK